MKTAYEFLPTKNRRIRTPISLLVILGIMFSSFILTHIITRYLVNTLKNDISILSIDVKNKVALSIDKIEKGVQTISSFSNLETKINSYNLAIGGKRSAWTKFFNLFETMLPGNSVVMSIVNPITNNSSFKASERTFKINIAVADKDSVNKLYQQLSSQRAIKALSFVPKGNVRYQGKNCRNIELNFVYSEENE